MCVCCVVTAEKAKKILNKIQLIDNDDDLVKKICHEKRKVKNKRKKEKKKRKEKIFRKEDQQQPLAKIDQ